MFRHAFSVWQTKSVVRNYPSSIIHIFIERLAVPTCSHIFQYMLIASFDIIMEIYESKIVKRNFGQSFISKDSFKSE